MEFILNMYITKNRRECSTLEEAPGVSHEILGVLSHLTAEKWEFQWPEGFQRNLVESRTLTDSIYRQGVCVNKLHLWGNANAGANWLNYIKSFDPILIVLIILGQTPVGPEEILTWILEVMNFHTPTAQLLETNCRS